MMISKAAEYALRVVVVLAHYWLQCVSRDTILTETRIPKHYCRKVFNALIRSGLVMGKAGKGGGYILRRSPEDVSMLEVIQAVDPIPRLSLLPLGLASQTDMCMLHRYLCETNAATERAFAQVTIAQLLNQADSVPPLCELH